MCSLLINLNWGILIYFFYNMDNNIRLSLNNDLSSCLQSLDSNKITVRKVNICYTCTR